MAFIKNYNFKGFDCDYWTITNIKQDKFYNLTYIIFSLFKNKEHYLLLKQNTEEGFNISDHKLTDIFAKIEGYNLLLEQIYPMVKLTSPIFFDAIDDI